MAVFDYHYGLDERALQTFSKDDQQLIRAAFAVAMTVHGKQSRRKVDPSVMYISHPLMVFDLVYRYEDHKQPHFAELMAATLLHDAIEDSPIYRHDPGKMLSDLQAACKEQGLDCETNIAHQLSANRIFTLCEQLTNPPGSSYPFDKRTYQADRVMHQLTDPDARILKMADQMASLICQLTMADDPAKFSKEKARQSANKGNDLIRAVLDTKPYQKPNALVAVSERQYAQRLQPWRGLYTQVVDGYLRRLLKASDAAAEEQIRREFAKDPLPITRMEKPKALIGNTYDILKDIHGHGLASVTVNAQDEVISYVNWESPDNQYSYRNRLQVALRDGIEAAGERDVEVYSRGFTRVRLKPGQANADNQFREQVGSELWRGRIYMLSKPMKLDRFLDIAEGVTDVTKDGVERHAISPQERNELTQRIAHLKRVNSYRETRQRT